MYEMDEGDEASSSFSKSGMTYHSEERRKNSNRSTSRSNSRSLARARLSALKRASHHSLFTFDFSAINEYINRTYGPGKRTTEMQFSYHLAMAGGFNIRIYILLFFAFWTMMTSVMLLNMFNANNIYKIRCEISELEHKFSFDQIHQLTAKRDGDTAQSCHYYNISYGHIAKEFDYNYTAMLNKVNTINATLVKCDRIVIKYIKGESARQAYLAKDLRFYCEEQFWSNSLWILTPIGSLFTVIPLGLIADLYGRKPAFLISSITQICGSLIVFGNTLTAVILAQIIIGFAGHVPTFSAYMIFTEQCNLSSRPHLGYLLLAADGVASLVLCFLYYYIGHWWFEYVCICCFFYCTIFFMWYVNESPRWMFYACDEAKAWNILYQDVKIRKNLTSFEPLRERPRPSLYAHFSLFKKPFFRSRIIIHITLFGMGAGIYFTDPSTLETELATSVLNFYLSLGVGKCIGIFVVYLLLLFAERKKVECFIYTLISILSIAIFLQEEQKSLDMGMYYLMLTNKSLCNAALYLLYFHHLEQYPTTHRFTALSFCFFSIEGARTIKFFLSGYWRPQPRTMTYFPLLILSVTCALLVFFLHETKYTDLPDTPREALAGRFLNIANTNQ